MSVIPIFTKGQLVAVCSPEFPPCVVIPRTIVTFVQPVWKGTLVTFTGSTGGLGVAVATKDHVLYLVADFDGHIPEELLRPIDDDEYDDKDLLTEKPKPEVVSVGTEDEGVDIHG